MNDNNHKIRKSSVRNPELESKPVSNNTAHPLPKTQGELDKLPRKDLRKVDLARKEEKEIAEAALNWSEAKFSKTLKKSLLIISISILLGLFLFLPSFRFQKIESNQLFFTDFETIFEASELKENQHFFTAYGPSLKSLITGRYTLAEEKILEDFPQLKSIKIGFDFPGTLSFEIEERIPVAFLDVNDLYVTLDRFGVVCGSYTNIPSGLPAIRGVEAIKMQLGEPILTNADDDLKACIAVMSSIVEADFESQGDSPLLNQVSEIRSSGYQRIVLKLVPKDASGQLVVVVTSESQLKEDFLWLKRVLDSGVLNDKLPGTLDIFGSQLVFRPDRPMSGEEEIDLSGD